MSEVTITVRADSAQHLAPERATIRLSVRQEAMERATAVDGATMLAEPIRARISAQADAGIILDWSSAQLTVRAERPWLGDGRRGDHVYTASIDMTATFADAAELSAWTSEISSGDGIEVHGVEWWLTPETRIRVEREVASDAVGSAVTRGEAYAHALGLTEVVPVEIADIGLLSSPSPTPEQAPLLATRFAAGGAPGMVYEPTDIVISATVEARFLAR